MSGIKLLGPYDRRLAVRLPEGYVVGSCTADCTLGEGADISGVLRRVGEQLWSDGRNSMTVLVEDFDLDDADFRNWSTGVE